MECAVPFASSGDGTGIGLFVIRDVLLQLSWAVASVKLGMPPTQEGKAPRSQ
jgi:hypothetical protein